MTTKKTPRNAPCPCGSGRKYKYCCLGKEQALRRERRYRDVARVRGELEWVWRLRRPLPVERGGI